MHLKEHISKTRHSVNLYQCRECGIPFSEYKDLDEHWLATHQEATGRRRFFPCFLCKNTFNSRQQVVKHNCDSANSLHLAYMDKKRFEKLQGHKPKSNKKASKIKEEPGAETHICDRCRQAFASEGMLELFSDLLFISTDYFQLQMKWCATNIRCAKKNKDIFVKSVIWSSKSLPT
jgi:hypothetical protein